MNKQIMDGEMILDWITKRFAFVVIVFVSSCAFAAGFVQNNLAERSDDYRETAAGHERNVERMQEKAADIKQRDGDLFLGSLDEIREGVMIALEYMWYYDNLSLYDRFWYQIELFNKLIGVNGTNEATLAGQIHYVFQTNPSRQTYELATKEDDGYDYIIKREHWEKYPPVIEWTPSSFAEYWKFDTIASLIVTPSDILDQMPDPYVHLEWDNINALFRQPIYEEIDDKEYYQDLADRYEGYVNRITIGVAVTTVATVLVATMTARIADKKNEHDFSQIRADVLKNRALLVSEKDMIAYVVLLLAALISIIGVILPFFSFSL
jgi:hypothetical protein